MTDSEGLLRAGNILHGTYRIDGLIGLGGTGEVYRAQNVVSHRTVAIKILKKAYSTNEKFIDLMRRELLRNVNSDAVVKYYELLRTEEYDGLHFLVMELIEGPSLADLMAQAPVDPAILLAIARRVAEGLRVAHAAGVFHRDISPDNLLLRDGDPAGTTLIDFGIAKDLNPDARTVIGGGFAGKYEYAAPEQFDGRADAQSDLYALGATLLAAARGRPEQMPDDFYELRRLKDEPVDVSDQPEPLRGLLAALLAPDRARRMASAADLERALAQAGPVAAAAPRGPVRAPTLAQSAPDLPGSTTARRPAKTPAPAEKKRSGGGGIILAVAGLAVAGGLAAFVLLGPGKEMLFGPSLPAADIYRLSAALEDGVTLTGDAPSTEEQALLAQAAALSARGRPVENTLRLASGEPTPQWAEELARLLTALTPLETWKLDVVGLRATLRGVAETEEAAASVTSRARAAADAAGVTLDVALTARRKPLDAGQIEAVLSAFRGCGPLAVVGGMESREGPVTVSGRVLDRDAAAELKSALERVLGDRPLVYDVAPLNRHVCRIITLLRRDGPGEIGFRYANAQTGQGVEGDSFPEDANPVIDVVLPADLTGWLHVFAVGSDGEVAPLLPHNNRLANQVETMGTVEGDMRVVRIAYPEAEASPERLSIWFEPPFGANIVIAVLAQDNLYTPQRFLLENIEEFAPEFAAGLSQAQRDGGAIRFGQRLLLVDGGDQ